MDTDPVEGIEEHAASSRRGAGWVGTPCTGSSRGRTRAPTPARARAGRLDVRDRDHDPFEPRQSRGRGRRARRARPAAERRRRARGRARTPPPSRCRGCSTRARTSRTTPRRAAARTRLPRPAHPRGEADGQQRPAGSSSAATRAGDRSQPPPISFVGVELDRSAGEGVRGLAPRDRDRQHAEREPREKHAALR